MSKATVRLMHPFQCWCLSGRGRHEHFRLRDFFKAIKARNKYNNQGTKCFCPKCDNELCGSGSYIDNMCDQNRFEHYKCSKCGKESKWDFDMPCPFLVEDTMSSLS
jgi:hypothetical protein